MDTKQIIGFVIALAVIIGGIAFVASRHSVNGPDLTAFAQCIKNSGTLMYGAFWCPHCQATKRMFGSAASELPYIECSTPDGKGQTTVCKDKQIAQYPTWVYPDGTRESGELTLQHLADKTSCQLPASTS